MQSAKTLIKPFSLVVAQDKKRAIGFKGSFPWPMIKGDLTHFANVTKIKNGLAHPTEHFALQKCFFTSAISADSSEKKEDSATTKMNAIVMGRKTWESIPEKLRPLNQRINVIITRQADYKPVPEKPEQTRVYNDLEKALVELTEDSQIDEIFVVGGSDIYAMCLSDPLVDYCKLVITTRINKAYKDADVFMPEFNGNFTPIFVSQTYSQPKDGITWDYCFQGNIKLLREQPSLIPTKLMEMYPKHPEMQYLEAIKDIINTGVEKPDRTGTGILTKFGYQMRYDLKESFPLLTTKDVFWRGVAEELVWFVKGDTNAKHLSDKRIRIWDGNASRQFLDNLGLTEREEWDLGPVYGFQWRHFGAAYDTMHANYEGKGIDQLQNVINQIKTQPESRRILLSAWNPAALHEMALPPCHILAQFYVSNNRLSCQMYQRSCDMGLGVPFNIASYSLLTCMLAQVCGLERGEFIHVLGDSHVYTNHVEPLQEQLKRTPHPFPYLELNPECKDIEDFQFKDFKLINYTHDPKIKMQMAV